jgi:hypothetical protein
MQSSLAGFLSYCEAAHKSVANRYIHHVAHSVAVVASSFCGAHSSASRWSQALSWLGHYLFERNTPAFFDAPNRSGPAASIAKKAQVACGGIVWSAACFLRLFHRGPLVEERR